MSSSFIELSQDKLNNAVIDILVPRIKDILNKRGPGHCMRITDLDDDVIESLCSKLQKQQPESNIYILAPNKQKNKANRITSTKLVELRNPRENGSLRPPLLVFLPVSLRTSAEDSFGIATFEELSFTGVYEELIKILLKQIPKNLIKFVQDIFFLLDEKNWLNKDAVAKVRYLLTALENGIDGETLGAALYELALIPDFRLFENPDASPVKIRKNIESVQQLIDSDKSVRGRISDIKLKDKSLTNNLLALFELYDVHDPEIWTRHITLEKGWWQISFDKWTFTEDLSLEKIDIRVIETDLPVISEDEEDEALSELVGQQILNPKDRKKMSIKFEVLPHPQKVKGLEHFSVQIISQTGGPIGKSKKVKAWKPKRNHCSVNLAALNKIDFEQGWHYIRVLPWTSENDPVPMSYDSRTDSPDVSPNESEPFYVLPGNFIEEDPPQRAIPYDKSLEHARFRLQFTAVNENRNPFEIDYTQIIRQESKTGRNSNQEKLIAKFGREGKIQISVSRILKSIEQRILTHPSHLSGWRMQINMDTPELPVENGFVLPSSSAMKTFLAIRTRLFSAIRQGNSELIIQGFSFRDNRKLCEEYVESYLDLIQSLMQRAGKSGGQDSQLRLRELRNILAVDSIHIILTDFRGKHREAVLVAPTHPLRIIWLLSWTMLGEKWLNEIKTGGKEYLPTVRKAFLENIQTINYPVGIPVEDGRVFLPLDNLNPVWGLYATSTEQNTRGLLAEICSALGLPEPEIAGTDISGSVLADKIERYLSQHPYVRELSINVFNPGSGAIIASALTELQQKQEYAGLRYNVRLFASDPESPVLGDALKNMIKPDTSQNLESKNAFALSTGNHLFSKLSLGTHRLEDFNDNEKKYEAHIGILLDVFSAAEMSVSESESYQMPLYGLIQDYHIDFIDDSSGTFWQKTPKVGTPEDIDKQNECFGLLSVLSSKISKAVSAVATSGATFTGIPMMTLGLDLASRELIYRIHQTCDWVFTIDRNMGIEFFDHGGQKDRPDYLIDFIPGTVGSHGMHNLIISSCSTEELAAMLKPVLQNKGFDADSSQALAILTQLRSLSGQLALKLISAPSQQAEALGLALARMFLDYQGALSNQIIVPLDAHTDLYRTSNMTDESYDAVSLQRTDLALFDLDLGSRTITCNLVEVKCYSYVGDLSVFNHLKERISIQINQSERIIQRHFDPLLKTPDRPDRLLKSRELSKILRFYLERSMRYEIFKAEAAQEADIFLKSIEKGYSLKFRRCALIFDFDKDGTDAPDNEVGIEFHRIGKNLIQDLLEGCKKPKPASSDDVKKDTASFNEQIIPTLPRLDSAAFLAQPRERITSSENIMMIPDDFYQEESYTTLLAADDDRRAYDSDNTNEKNENKEISELIPSKKVSETKKNTPISNKSSNKNRESSEPEKNVRSNENLSLQYDVILGMNSDSPQFGILGEIAGRKIALDLNQTHTISLFGVQGGGKSYTLGTIIEMASMQLKNLNILPSPLATVIFHYSPTQDYAPEFTSMNRPNSIAEEVRILKEKFSANPKALKDIIILTPADKVDERRIEFPDIEVYPIAFSASELKAAHWKFLMGAIGSQSMYMRQINLIMRKLRNNISLESLKENIKTSGLSDHLKELAMLRLQFAEEYISENQNLQDLIRPGRLIIVDLRDEYIEKDEALGLFVVMLQIFSEATLKGQAFNKLVVFDEAHKYIDSDDLVNGLVEVVREMRHKGTSIMVASQDPSSVPGQLIELSTQIIMHKFNSPAWLKHIQKTNAALNDLTSEKMSRLNTGEAYVWSSKASDKIFSREAVKIKCRPRVTQHGGSTKTAVNN